jgi:hypothetical protein
MGKSPGKWIKSVLLGKKSTKSGSTKANESVSTSIMRMSCFKVLFTKAFTVDLCSST